MGLTFARALPRADSTTPTTGGSDGVNSNPNAKVGALDNASTSSGTSTSTSTSTSSSSSSTSAPGAPGSVSVEVWAPLVGIVAVIALMIIYTCFRKNSMNASMIAATRSANDAAASNSQSGTTTGRRRPRRTPSQISTRSLPVYMQDPGDQEIVLARGRLRRNRSRPDMPGETDDEYDSGDEDDMEDMEEHDRSLSQSDRPLLASTGTLTTTGTSMGGDSGMGRLAPPGRYDSRTSTSFDTMRLGSEDSQHALLRDEPDDMDHHEAEEGGTTYVFGEGTTGGQLYDERDNVEEHVEMRELGGGGVSMGSVSSSSSAGSVSGSRPAQNPSSSNNPSSTRRTTTALSPQPKPSFFSSISSILGNSLSSVAHSLSGMNASMSGAVLGGGSYNSIGDRSQQWGSSAARGDGSGAAPLSNGGTSRADAPSSDGANVRRHNTDATLSSVTTYHTSQTSHSGSALLAPPPPPPPSQLPPPYEGDNARSSTETRPRSQSRSSVRPIPFSRSRSRSGSNTNQNVVNPSASTLSLNNNNNTSSSHIRSPSSTSLSISAPLAHTVTKSTFMYPASGPTTEQIKFLSSREALGRFGMPYGHEAVAAAARAKAVTPTNGLSQGDDEAPPPSFEDVAGSSSYNSALSSGSSRNPSGSSNTTPTPIARPTQPTQTTTSPISPSDSKTSQYGPKRTDSVASRTSVRSNRSIAGPRGPRNSLRRSTLPAGVVGIVGVGAGVEDVSSNHIDRERTPRPSMDSVDSIDTVDSFGVGMKHGAQKKDHSALEQMEDMAFWATAADRVATEGEPATTTTTTNQGSTSTAPTTRARRPTLQGLPKLVVDNTSNPQSSILPTTIPRGFVMSSPPASPTPTTSTNPHANAFELGVPVITFAPATPSADSHGHDLG
ncbi:hypothetical protein Clacol_008747 [Clathrus columnatus]|uniref:Uncharacterized protein n=1 Tax=Clathrus columnatus TaxID=1419009 RepID=A0AAV5AN47_9AGAM|nr:hypothetical protein Clacol_008747 [Clathrus columnatus]